LAIVLKANSNLVEHCIVVVATDSSCNNPSSVSTFINILQQ